MLHCRIIWLQLNQSLSRRFRVWRSFIHPAAPRPAHKGVTCAQERKFDGSAALGGSRRSCRGMPQAINPAPQLHSSSLNMHQAHMFAAWRSPFVAAAGRWAAPLAHAAGRHASGPVESTAGGNFKAQAPPHESPVADQSTQRQCRSAGEPQHSLANSPGCPAASAALC